MKKSVKLLTLLLWGAGLTPIAAQTQNEMNKEAAAGFRAADEELNSTYRKILAQYAEDDVFVASLKEAQRCWIAFRDAQVKMKYPDREPGSYGSVLPMCLAMYLTELTQDRIKALNVWVDGAEEGEVCAGSVKVMP